MEILLFAPFEILFLAVLIYIGYHILQKPISIILPEKYPALKQQYSKPLYSWGWLSGIIKRGIFGLRIRGLLKIDVYEKMIIVSSMDQAICLPYDKHIFKQEKFLFIKHLVIEKVPVNSKSEGNNNFIKINLPIKRENFKTMLENSKVSLKIRLSEDKISTILHLAYK